MDAWICVAAEALETQRCQISTDRWAQLLSAGQWEQRLKNNPAVAGARVCWCVFWSGCQLQVVNTNSCSWASSCLKKKHKTSYTRTHAFGEIVKNSYLSVHIPPSCWVIEFALAFEGNLHSYNPSTQLVQKGKRALWSQTGVLETTILYLSQLYYGVGPGSRPITVALCLDAKTISKRHQAMFVSGESARQHSGQTLLDSVSYKDEAP